MKEKEVWKDVVWYEGLYQVSNLGRVKSVKRLCGCRNGHKRINKERILKPQNSIHGNVFGKYTHYCLSKDGKTKCFSTHKMVAVAFIPNPDNLPQINHKDENPSNNRVDNLEWCDGFYNHNYGTISTRTSQTKNRNNSDYKGLLTKMKNSTVNAPKPVVQMDDSGSVINVFLSAKDAERSTGIFARNIRRCCSGEFVHCGGYRWKFK